MVMKNATLLTPLAHEWFFLLNFNNKPFINLEDQKHLYQDKFIIRCWMKSTLIFIAKQPNKIKNCQSLPYILEYWQLT